MSSTAIDPDLGVVIGLEVHVQLETETKIFCGCPTSRTDSPNTNVCPVCLGLPGALPVLNERAVEAAVKVGNALGAEVPEQTAFHRKNYFYPDLPKGFQISQYGAPICRGGTVEISVGNTNEMVRINRAHLEEDPGSLRHIGGSIDTAEYTLIDYNRAGTPLMEIVTEPDLRSPAEARTFLRKLTEMLEYLEVFDTSRDGSLRVDANISLIPREDLGHDRTIEERLLESANRTEVKNISSHKGAEKALAYEVSRQKNAVQHGRSIEQETRHWDEDKGITLSMRAKEAEKDYRYFREADLPVLQVATWKDTIDIPELPAVRRERFRESYGLDHEAASKLTSTKQVADFYEQLTAEFDPEIAATWVADNLLGELNYRELEITDVADRLDEFRRLIELVVSEEITQKNAEEIVLRRMLDGNVDPDTIVETEGLRKADPDAVEEAVVEALDENPEAIADYESGEDTAINYLVGQVMEKTGGSADPTIVNQLLREQLADT